jgi:hypothetical protein
VMVPAATHRLGLVGSEAFRISSRADMGGVPKALR